MQLHVRPLTWDFHRKGKGQLYANYATFIERRVRLDVNVRAGGRHSHTDNNFQTSIPECSVDGHLSTKTGFTTGYLWRVRQPIVRG